MDGSQTPEDGIFSREAAKSAKLGAGGSILEIFASFVASRETCPRSGIVARNFMVKGALVGEALGHALGFQEGGKLGCVHFALDRVQMAQHDHAVVRSARRPSRRGQGSTN